MPNYTHNILLNEITFYYWCEPTETVFKLSGKIDTINVSRASLYAWGYTLEVIVPERLENI